MKITATRNGLRLSQHGVVISELRTSAGPTHSVFDVLAALITTLAPEGRIGVLGFAGGGMMAPLNALRFTSTVHSVDLDREGYDLFRKHCPEWSRRVAWQQADAVKWLRAQPRDFSFLLEDLSIPSEGDVFKPAVCWDVLPGLIGKRLRRSGIAAFNLLKPQHGRWNPEFARVVAPFATAMAIDLEEFENRILVAGSNLPSARELGSRLRSALHEMRSKQADRIRVSSVAPNPPRP